MRLILSSLLYIVLVSACAHTPAPQKSLYEQLGEKQGITVIVDSFLGELANDRSVLPMFADTDIGRFREKLIEFLCVTADGPCEYTGDSMAETHRGMTISHAQFNSLVDDLIQAMEHQRVATSAQNALLKRLAALYGEIMGETESAD